MTFSVELHCSIMSYGKSYYLHMPYLWDVISQSHRKWYFSYATSISVCVCVCVCVCARACVHARALSCQVVSEFLQPHELKLARLFCPWDFPSKNTGVGYHILLEGVLPTQGLSLFHYVL